MAYPKDYSSNVFINCPFDDLYKPSFDALVFTIHDCGYIARCAKEVDDSGDVRITKIMRIINECIFGIHDISKADLDLATGLARFNMPLELGIFIGCHQFSVNKGHNKEKRSLIMDIELYRYRSFISDLSGQDIKSHNNNPEIAIQNVRDFLVTNSRRTSIAGSRYIFGRYNQFSKDLPTICAGLHKDITELTFIEFSDVVTGWISKYPIS
jgi:hypothetical protein